MADKSVITGTIDTGKIFDAHNQIKKIVEDYNEIRLTTDTVTARLRQNWVGDGRNEFELQYANLISKIADFGAILLEIYNALVDAEAAYETVDDDIRQQITMSLGK